MAEFKIEVPIDVKNSSSGAGGGDNSPVVKEIKNLNKSILKTVDVWELLTQFMGDVIKALSPLIKILSLLFFMILRPMLPAIKLLVQILAILIKAVDRFWDIAIGSLTEFVLNIIMIGKDIWTALKWLWEMLTLGAGLVWEAIKWVGEMLMTGAVLVWEGIVAIVEIFSLAAVFIWDSFVAGFQFILTIGQSIWDFFLTGLSFIADIGVKIWDFFLGGLSFISNLGQRIWDWISSALNNIVSSIGGFFGGGRSSRVNDAIISPTGDIITTDPADFLIATKDPKSLGGGAITINVSGNSFNSEQDIRKMVNLISQKLSQKSNRSFS
jgi:hypothetical protein